MTDEKQPTMDCTCGHHEHLHKEFEWGCDWNSDRVGDDPGGFNCRCMVFDEISS